MKVINLEDLPSVKRYSKPVSKNPMWSYQIVKAKLPRTSVLFGIETEIKPIQELPYWDTYEFNESPLVREIRKRMGNRVAIHSDGGVEVDSPPLTYNDTDAYIDLLFGKPLRHARKNQPRNSGMHVHISKAAFTEKSLERLIEFLCARKNSVIISKIAERSTIRAGYYGYIPTMKGFTRSIVNPWNYRSMKNWKKGRSDRFGIAINTRHNTHEFRLFRSTVNPTKAKANIQFVKSFADFFRSNEGGMEEWLRFLKKNRSTYPQAYYWMRKMELM